MKIEKAMDPQLRKGLGNALELWHQRLSHADKNAIARMVPAKNFDGIDLREKALEEVSRSCMEGKLTNTLTHVRNSVCKITVTAIHSDFTHISAPSLGGSKYLVTFFDEATSHIIARALKLKNEEASELVKYVSWIDWQTGNKIKSITIDGADKKDYAHAVKVLGNQEVEFKPSAPYTLAEKPS